MNKEEVKIGKHNNYRDVIFGIYAYSHIENKYLYNPTGISILDIDVAKNIDTSFCPHMAIDLPAGIDKNDMLKDFKVINTRVGIINNVTFVVKQIAKAGFEIEAMQKDFNTVESLSIYIDAICERIVALEERWTDLKNTVTEKDLKDMFDRSPELKTTVDCLEEHRDEYYTQPSNYTNPFVPYRDFIFAFVGECNFYDIIPLLEKRIILFQELKNSQNS